LVEIDDERLELDGCELNTRSRRKKAFLALWE